MQHICVAETHLFSHVKSLIQPCNVTTLNADILKPLERHLTSAVPVLLFFFTTFSKPLLFCFGEFTALSDFVVTSLEQRGG